MKHPPAYGENRGCGYRTKKIRDKNSERFARNPALLGQPRTFGSHQILRHVNSSEFRKGVKCKEFEQGFTESVEFNGG